MRFGAIAGPEGPAGSPFVPVGLLVYTEADLPPPVGNVITLGSNTVYQIMSIVTITAGRRIVCPADTSIVGFVPNITQLIGDVDASLVTVVAPTVGSSHRIAGCRVENTNAGVNARAIETNSAAAVTTIDSCYLKAAYGALRTTVAASMKVLGTTLVATAAAADCVSVEVASALAFEYCQSQTGLAGVHFNSSATTVVGNFTVLRHGVIFGDVGQVAFRAAVGYTLTGRCVFERILRFGAAGTMNVGWDQGSARFRALSVEGMPDSTAIGGSAVATPGFVVPIAALNTWTPIAPAAGTPWIAEAHAERFELVSGANGQIRYLGVDPLRFLFMGGVTLSKTGTTVATKLGLFVNGALHPGSDSISDVTTRATNRSIAPVIGVLNQNDVLDLRVMNLDNADDFTCDAGSFACLSANIS